MTGYQPNWDLDRLRGETAEQLVDKLRTSILEGTVEVKHDERANDTGNFYVEWECRRLDGQWHRSGISVTRAEAWAIVSGQCVLVVPTEALREVARRFYRAGRSVYMHRGSHPTRGVLIPVGELLALAISLTSQELADIA